MNQLIPKGFSDIGGVSPPIAEKVNLSISDHSASDRPAIVGSAPKNVPDAIADKDRSLMAKFSSAFFNYLRSRSV